MTALLQPVILRFIAYVLTPAMLAIPAAWAGLVVYDGTAQTLAFSLQTLSTLIAAGIMVNGAISGVWGKLLPQQTVRMLALRLITYAASSGIGLLPPGLAGFVSYNATTAVITVTLPGLVTALLVALGGSFAVFKKWGVK